MYALVALALTMSGAGCDGLFGSDSSNGLLATDGGACIKNAETLSELLAQPQSCAVTAQCPTGSYCDLGAGRCDWDCFSDSDCGSSYTCSCEGHCLAGGPGADAGPAVDPSCPRDLGLLAGIEDRACLRDEHCAVGSRCDEVTRRCTYDCVADTDCAPGTVCDCSGACVAPGGADDAAATSKPATAVTPSYVVVMPGGTWGKQTLSVRIENGGSLPLETAPQARIEVLDPDGLGHLALAASQQAGETVVSIGGVYFSTAEAQRALAYLATATNTQLVTDLHVQTDRAAAIVAARPITQITSLVDAELIDAAVLQLLKTRTQIAGTFTCTDADRTRILSGTDWVVDTAAAGYAATASVSVGRCVSAPDDAIRRVAVSTYLVDRNDPTRIVRHLDYRVIDLGTSGAISDAPTPTTGIYQGSIVIAGRAAGERMSIPVHAWATRADALVLFDELAVLSDTGRIELGAQPTFIVAVDPAGDGSRGRLTAQISGWQDYGGSNGIRTGSFLVTFGSSARPQQAVYALRRTGDPTHVLSGADSPLALAPVCNSATACTSGSTCVTALGSSGTDLTAGRCVAGAASTASALADSVEHPTEAAWRQAGAFLDTLHDLTDTSTFAAPMSLGDRLICHAYGAELIWYPNLIFYGLPLGLQGLIRAADVFTPVLPTTIEPNAGDVYCQQAEFGDDPGGLWLSMATFFTPTAVPLVSGTRSKHPDDSHPLQVVSGAKQRLEACLGDLERTIPSIDIGGDINQDGTFNAAALRAKVETWFGTGGTCINPAQVFPALGAFTRNAVAGEAVPAMGVRSAGLFQHLLAQWLDVHAFIAQQGAQEREASASLDGTSDPAITLTRLMDTVERGWDLLLDQSYTSALAKVPQSTLRHTDYRELRPSSYYSFDAAHTNGQHVVDLAGNDHLQMSGAFVIEDDHLRRTSTGYGLASTADPQVSLNEVTVSFWIDTASLPVGTTYAYYQSPALAVRVIRNSTNQWQLAAGHPSQNVATTALATVGGWKHLAVVRQRNKAGGAYRLYVDGVFKTEGSFTAEPQPGYSRFVAWGGTGFTIDELGIWDHALSYTDIATLHSRGRGNLGALRLAPLDPLWDPAVWGNQPNHEQGLGLATKILDLAANHARLVETYTDEMEASIYGSCYLGGSSPVQQEALARASKGLRYLTAAEALAADLYRRASEVPCTGNLECTLAAAASGETPVPALTCGSTQVCADAGGTAWLDEPAWGEAYRDALARFTAARAEAITALKHLEHCENPLGIPEEDLPLYFGDVSGDNARFFASSDYLMETWARPAVAVAMNALSEARTAWQSMRQSNVQQLMNQYAAEERMEGLVHSFVQPIIEACGLTEYAVEDVIPAFETGELSSLACYRVPGCSGNSSECVRGQMGDALLTIKSAVTALRIENRQQERRQVEWEAEIESCERVTRSIHGDLAAIDDYNEKAEAARRQSKGFFGTIGGWLDDTFDTGDFFEDALQYYKNCRAGADAGAAQGLAAGGPLGAAILGAKGCADGIDSTYAAIGGQKLDEAKDALQQTLTQSDLLRSVDACWDEVHRRARDVEYGVDFARQQLVNLEQARFHVDELVRATDRNVREAGAVLERERGRTLPSVAHHFWTDEKIARFRRELERARRMTFLAMRSAEYELQQSFGLRSAILTATHPDQLEQIIEEIDTERAARSINSHRPAEGTEVLSLRTDILGLQDLRAAGPGERSDAATLRLQQILTSPDYAMWDREGNYLGQGIPFKLSETGALRHRCAERLWRVSATIQGDLTEVEEPGTHVFLLKNDVFQSQWCTGLGDGSDYQQASTSHTSNLFQSDEVPGDGERTQYTTAAMFPWFNVRRSEFYRDAYTEGASEELAGRGLYGEYVLLFPYHGMLEASPDCYGQVDVSCADPYRDLAQVEDVLIRFDYYSVDDLSL